MNKTINLMLTVFSLFALTACSEPAKTPPKAAVQEPPQEQGQTTHEVMKSYTDNLAAAKGKAEAVSKANDARTAEMERNIKEMDNK